MKNPREQWGSRIGFILAAAGSALFVGWFWGKDKVLSSVQEESERFKGWIASLWIFVVRYVTPIMILLACLLPIGIL